MNKIQLMGRLGADPEIRFTQGGKKLISMRMATNSRRGGKDETHWWSVTVWPDRLNIEPMMPYLKKGSALIVYGELSPGMYTDREGKQAIALNVTAESVNFSPFGSPDRQNQEGGQQRPQAQGAPTGGFAEQSQPYGASVPEYGQAAARSHVEEEPLPF